LGPMMVLGAWWILWLSMTMTGASALDVAALRDGHALNASTKLFGFLQDTHSLDDSAKGARAAVVLPAKVCGESGLCSGHGACNLQTGTCECTRPFDGDVCDIQRCPGFHELGQNCHGNGLCESGTCACYEGWGTLPGSSLEGGCQHRVCPLPCDHGECVEGTCQCLQGWTGVNCRDPKCPGGCAGHGSCSLTSTHSPGECICDHGWAGAGCQRPALFAELRGCPQDCSGNGLCMDGWCNCNVGYTGLTCSERKRIEAMSGPDSDRKHCPSDCNGQGLCLGGKCACWEAFVGNLCSIPFHCHEPCTTVCEGELEASEKCKFCVGQCMTLREHPVMGVHNPFDDLTNTLLQLRQHSASSRGRSGVGATAMPVEVSAVALRGSNSGW